MELLKVVVPMYRLPNALEQKSLEQCFSVLGKWQIVFLVQEGLDISSITDVYPQAEVIRVTTEWLGTLNGIAGYNRMMLSAGFYDLFADTEYILIYQLDAWIFSDDLAEWCSRGYDYVGAPWIRRKVYNLPVIKQYMQIKKYLVESETHLLRQSRYDRVGNGGFSLRRISSFRCACDKYSDRIDYYLAHIGHLYNEDVFWALVPKEFSRPSTVEALDFAIDMNPAYCMRMRGGKLPMGCHGWTEPRYLKFWISIIIG